MEENRGKLSVLLGQYGVVWKNIEYLDSTLFKVIGLYSVLSGALLANVDKFSNFPLILPIFTAGVGLICFLMLKRTTALIDLQVQTIHNLEAEMAKIEAEIQVQGTFPRIFGKGMRISTIGMVGILFMTIVSIIAVYKF